MKCINCGREIPEDSLFCEFCGTRVAPEKSDAADEFINQADGICIAEIRTQSAAENGMPENEHDSIKSKKRNILPFIIGFAVIAIATFVICDFTDVAINSNKTAEVRNVSQAAEETGNSDQNTQTISNPAVSAGTDTSAELTEDDTTKSQITVSEPDSNTDTEKKINTLTVKFDNNGSQGYIKDITASEDSKVTIPNCSFTKEGYTFQYWYNSKNEKETYTPGQNITISDNLTLKAQWKEIVYYTVTLNSNDDSNREIQYTVAEGNCFRLNETPFEKTGFTLSGWSVDAKNRTYGVNMNISVASDITLYAWWNRTGKTEDGTLEYRYSNELRGWEVSWSNSSASSQIVIPESFDGIPVVSIGYYAIKNVKRLSIPKTIMNIENNAIYSWDSMTIAVDPANEYFCAENGLLMSLDKKELIYCFRSLTGKYTIPSSIEVLRCGSFVHCNASTIEIGPNVRTIEEGITNEAQKLTKIIVDTSNENYYADQHFLYEKSTGNVVGMTLGFTGTLEIPEGIKKISSVVFHNCQASKFIIPASVDNIEYGAFENNEATAFVVSEDNKKYESVDGVLFSKDGKTLIRYPEKKSGSSYYVPDSVTKIERMAFRGLLCNYCTTLKKLYIPSSVTECASGVLSAQDVIGTIYFQTAEIPEGFNENWINSWSGDNSGCKLVFNEKW